MRKKGLFGLEEGIKIVLAIAGIFILILLIVKLAGIWTSKAEEEQAKATLEEIKYIIDNLKEGETKEYIIQSPKGWFLVSYLDGITNTGNLKNSIACTEKNCLCICKPLESSLKMTNELVSPPEYYSAEDLLNYFFNNKGIDSCQRDLCVLTKDLIVNNQVKFSVGSEGWEVQSRDVYWISFSEIPVSIKVSEDNLGKIIIAPKN